MDTLLHRETEAALAGIAKSLPASTRDSALACVPLAKIGDALRLGLEVPGSVRRWADSLTVKDLAGIFTVLAEAPTDPALPDEDAVDLDDPFLIQSVRGRDEVESIICAIERVANAAGLALHQVGTYEKLSVKLSLYDASLRELLTAEQVTVLLGTRAQLQAEGSWTAAFTRQMGAPERESREDPGGPAFAGEPTEPSEEIVLKYVATGSLAQYVEGYAGRDVDFAQGLVATIDALRAAGEQVGLAARRWYRDLRITAGSVGVNTLVAAAAIQIPAGPRRMAASTGGAPASRPDNIDLGWLYPIKASAMIAVMGDQLEISVFPQEPTSLQLLVFGETEVRGPDPSGRWAARVPRTSGPIRLRILTADGSEFLETLEFSPPDPV
jgi:hypothetical protein